MKETLQHASETREGARALPPHLAELDRKAWAVWRWFGVRGAGFPITQVLPLASAATAAAADRVLKAERALAAACAEADQVVSRELNRISLDQGPTRPLLKLRKKLRTGQAPALAGGEAPAVRAALEVCLAARQAVSFALCDYEETHEREQHRIAKVIRELARDQRLREAVTWQNRRAVGRGFDSLLHKEPGTSLYEHRRNEDLVVNYIQRYCTKNETIGFFGPVGWGRCESEGGLEATPRKELLSSRRVYFENWGIEALAQKFESEAKVKLWLKPRRMPFIRVEGSLLYEPLEEPRELSELEERLLRACDGDRFGWELAQELAREGIVEREEDVYEGLEALRRRRWIRWEIEIGMSQYPERELRKWVESVGDVELRERLIAGLNELEGARDAVSRSAGDARCLNDALSGLEETFTRLTGTDATRAGGRTYAGRTLVYEDCLRGLDVRLGRAVRERMGKPMGLLLESARWLTREVERRYRKAFDGLYEKLRAGSRDEVECVDFWYGAQGMIFGGRSLVSDAMREMQGRWERVLGVDDGKSEVRYKSDELKGKVEEEFGGEGQGWTGARYHSPDVMLGRVGEEEDEGREYELVMGELHVGLNTLGAGPFVEQHPAKEELYEAVSSDLPTPRVLPVTPKFFPKNTSRTSPALFRPLDYCLETSPDTLHLPGARPVALASFVVRRNAQGLLVVQSRDGEVKFDVIEFFGETFSAVTSNHFKLLSQRAHLPRIYIDDLVVWRESWSVPVGELMSVQEKEGASRYLAMRRWVCQQGMPRFVFVKSPVEVKPYYVDFDSLVSVRQLEKLVRKTHEQGAVSVQITEMLPRPDQAWLPDAEGGRYTSEFRFVVLDLDQPAGISEKSI